MPVYPQHKTLPTVTTLGHTDTARSRFELGAGERGNPVEVCMSDTRSPSPGRPQWEPSAD